MRKAQYIQTYEPHRKHNHCLRCGALLPPSHGCRKYCNDDCRLPKKGPYKGKVWPDKTCVQCGEDFTPGTKQESERQRFCSKTCVYRSQLKPKEPKPLKSYSKECPQCGCGFSALRSNRLYCSRDCSNVVSNIKAGRSTMGLARRCSECGKEWVAEYGDQRTTFCSKKC